MISSDRCNFNSPVAPDTLKIHVAPGGRPARHGEAVGTVVTLGFPTAGHSRVVAPRMFWILLLRKVAIGRLVVIAEFFAAAISAVFELGAADAVWGLLHVPALRPAAFVPPM